MNVEAWLAAAVADAERRGLRGLEPMLETLARSLTALRAADEQHRARAQRSEAGGPPRGHDEP